jgi:two-component system sensor histidine kinase VanS
VTPDTDISGVAAGLNSDGTSDFMVYLYDGYSLHVYKDDIFSLRYGSLIIRVLVVGIVTLAVCVFCAFIFARQMTKPI